MKTPFLNKLGVVSIYSNESVVSALREKGEEEPVCAVGVSLELPVTENS